MPWLQLKFKYTAIDVRAWISNLIPLINMNIITYPHHNQDVGLAKSVVVEVDHGKNYIFN